MIAAGSNRSRPARSSRTAASNSNRFACSDNRFTNNRFQDRRWHRGERFDSRYATNYRVIETPCYYNLRPAPYGYRWVQSGNDAVLVAIASGIIGALMANAF